MRNIKAYDNIAPSDLRDGIKSGNIRICPHFYHDPAEDADILLSRVLRLVYQPSTAEKSETPVRAHSVHPRGIRTLNLLGLWYTTPAADCLPVLRVSINHLDRYGGIRHWITNVAACDYCQYADVCAAEKERNP